MVVGDGTVDGNQVERDAMIFVPLSKISRRYRTMKSATDFRRLRLVANTARDRGWNVIEIAASSTESFIVVRGYPAEEFDAFEKDIVRDDIKEEAALRIGYRAKWMNKINGELLVRSAPFFMRHVIERSIRMRHGLPGIRRFGAGITPRFRI